MKKAVSFFYLLATLISAVKVESLRCPNGERPYPPNSCINLSTDTSLVNAFTCGSSSSKLITFEDTEQFDTLSRYVELYQQNYWTGYRYNVSGTLIDSDDSPPSLGSPVLDSDNFASLPTAPPGPEAEGTCLFIGVDDVSNDVRLFRQLCSMELRYICADPVQAPIVSLTTSISRILSQGSSIILTCTAMNNDGPIVWRRNGTEIFSDTSGVVISGDTLTVTSYDEVTNSYECVVESRVGGMVSQAVVLESSGVENMAPTITQISSSQPTPVQFGTSVTLTCSFTTNNTLATVEWFISGALVSSNSLTAGDTEATYPVDNFSIVGVYQCRVFNENGENMIESLFISGTAGTPGLVTSPIIALADSQSRIFVSWLYPVDHNVLDPVLLRYEVFYQEGTNFNESTALSNTGLLPVLLNGQVSEEEDVQTTLTGLNPGTTYSVTIRAVSTDSSGGLNGGRVIVSTFGTVPEITVDDSLKVQRTTDNKTLFADWADVKTTPPVGQVARYWVEYRNSGKNGARNSAILNPKFSYLVVSPVEDAQNYQVRVRVGVVVEREPLTYDYGPFTKWVLVQGVTNTVPPVPPSEAIFPAAGVIVSVVVVPTLILALVLFIVLFGVACYCLKSAKKDNYSPRQRIESQAIDLKPKEQIDTKELEAMDPVII